MGAVFLAVAMFHTYGQVLFLANSNAVTLHVVEVESRTDQDGTSYRPTFEMIADDGARIRYKGNLWVNPPSHENDEIVSGRYEPATGEMQSDELIKTHHFKNGVFGLGGILFLLFALYRWRCIRRGSSQVQ